MERGQPGRQGAPWQAPGGGPSVRTVQPVVAEGSLGPQLLQGRCPRGVRRGGGGWKCGGSAVDNPVLCGCPSRIKFGNCSCIVLNPMASLQRSLFVSSSGCCELRWWGVSSYARHKKQYISSFPCCGFLYCAHSLAQRTGLPPHLCVWGMTAEHN